jgi:hypothetical protein
VPIDLLLSVSLILFAGGLGFLVTRRWDVSLLPFLVVAAVLILVGLSTQLAASPFYLGRSDGDYYLDWGFAISEAWRDGQPWSGRVIWPGKGVWPLLIAVVNYSFGRVLVALIVINALVFAFSIVFLQKATALLFGVRPKWTIIVLALTNPPALLFAPTLLRDAIFWFGISAGILAIAYLYRASWARGVVFLLLSVVVVLGIRPNLGVLIVFPLVAVAVVVWSLRKESVLIGRIFIGPTLLAILGAAFFPAVSALTSSDVVQTISRSAEALGRDNVTTALSDSAVTLSEEVPVAFLCDSASYLGILCDSLARLPALMFGPFLWEIGPEPVWIVVIASTLHFLFLFGTSVLFLFQKKANLATLGLFSLGLVTLLILAAILTNYGIIIRFRVVAELFLLPLSLGFLLQRGDGISPPTRGWRLLRLAPKSPDMTAQQIEGLKPPSWGR